MLSKNEAVISSLLPPFDYFDHAQPFDAIFVFDEENGQI